MGAPEILAGFSQSPLLLHAERERDPGKIALTVSSGLAVGLVAALACWMLLLAPYTLLAGLGGQGLAALGRVGLRLADTREADPDLTLLRLVVATATDACFLLAFVAMAAAIARRPLHAYVTVAVHIRWRLLAAGLALAAVALFPLVVADHLLSEGGRAFPMLAISRDGAQRAAYDLSALLLIPAAAAEELFFRGWLLRQAAAFTRRPAVLITITALLFAALHLDFNPDAFLTRAIMGAGLAYMTLRLGGIEFATGAHAANNILVVLFLQPLSPGAGTATGGLELGALIEDLAMVAGYVAITEAIVRIVPLRRLAGVRPEEISPPGLGAPTFS